MWRIISGDCRDVLATLPDESVQTCVTSPPYFGLRDYGTATWDGGDPSCDHRKVSDTEAAVASSTLGGGKKTTGHVQEGYSGSCRRCGAARIDSQLGLEPTPDEYVAALVETFREVRRVLRDDGTLWLNLGDNYVSNAPGKAGDFGRGSDTPTGGVEGRVSRVVGLKPKDLIGIPWRVAFALQADGWYLRSDIIWHKPNPMPESVTDRPTKAHEYLFLLSKSPRYFYDADAIREDAQDWTTGGPGTGIADTSERYGNGNGGNGGLARLAESYRNSRAESAYMGPTGKRHLDVAHGGRNKRSVWTVATRPYAEAHFATFPPDLIEPCVLAGCPADGTVLDPFAGAGTTGLVALRHGRSFVGIELNPEYVEMARRRIVDDAPLLNSFEEAPSA